MLMILSPAKTIDEQAENRLVIKENELEFSKETRELVNILREYSLDELIRLMKISDKLAILNYDRYKNFYCDNIKEYTAILAFKGEAYRGLSACDFTDEELLYSQSVLRILSGLYGVLKPLDRIKEYRLEMGTKFNNYKVKDLYDFWSDKITSSILEAIEKSYGDKVLINLASKEYSSSINMEKIKERYKVVNISFLELRDGKYKLIGTYAKKARGSMTRYIIKNRVKTLEGVKEFLEEGYEFNEYLSDKENLVFTR